MEKTISLVVNVLILMVLIGCSNKKEELDSTKENGWIKEGQVLKTIKNVNFNFPDNGFAFDNKKDFVGQCFEAMQNNMRIIGLNDFTDTIQIRFLQSRNDMNLLTGRAATGIAQPHIKTLYVVADSSEKVNLLHKLFF